MAKVKDPGTLISIVRAQKSSFFKTLTVVCRNFLVGNLKLSKRQKKKLEPHSKTIRALYDARDWKKQRIILSRDGGRLVYEIACILEKSLLQAISKIKK